MSTIKELHAKAMNLYEDYLFQKAYNPNVVDKSLLLEAFSLEKEAALSLKDKLDIEPTRGILFASAANMAVELEKFDEAKTLVNYGLLGEISVDLESEFKDILNNIDSQKQVIYEMKTKVAIVSASTDKKIITPIIKSSSQTDLIKKVKRRKLNNLPFNKGTGKKVKTHFKVKEIGSYRPTSENTGELMDINPERK